MKKQNESGFTLIELLIVIVILMTVGIFIVSTLFLTLRAATKTATIAKIRQNGNFALQQMAQQIRDAKRFDGISANGGLITTTNCSPSGITNTDATNPIQIQVADFNDNTFTLTCDGNSNSMTTTEVDKNGNPVTSGSLVDATKVNVSNCQVICTQASTNDPPSIDIKFTLSNTGGTGALQENQESQTFETQANMHNNIQNTQNQVQ